MKYFSFLFLALFITHCFSEVSEGRAGGGRSFGSRGSRSYSAPSRTAPQQPSRSYSSPPPYSNPSNGGGLLRSIGTGIAGGLIGSMLFRGLAGAGGGYGYGGGGIGFLDIILICILGFIIYRFFRSRIGNTRFQNSGPTYAEATGYPSAESRHTPFDSSFASQYSSSNEAAIEKEESLDIFFKIQNAFTNRDLTYVKDLLTYEASTFLQQQIDQLKTDHQINRLENIAVRDAVVTEQWQEQGLNYATVLFTANVIDYTIDENTQSLVKGSKSEPVKFEEYWTFSKASNSQWKLSAIQQLS